MARAYFADSFYWIALANARDGWHVCVSEWERANALAELITTEEVLSEVLTWFAGAGPEGRKHAAEIVRDIIEGGQGPSPPPDDGRLHRRPRPLRSPPRQRLQPDRLPVHERDAVARHCRGADQRPALHPGRVHDPIS